MTKKEFIKNVAERSGVSQKNVEASINAYHDAITDILKAGDKITFSGFGTYEVSERAARTGRNPQTGEEMTIAASKAPKFKAGKTLKDSVNA